ncbi:MAG: hypothetical protein IJN82_03490, partial [Clostridia bacterium]|nr:hypothetical protein [Clostridia bacterium]
MKKYLITVVTMLALLLGLGASSFALSEPYYVGDSLVDPLFRLSEDQQTLYYGEQSYQIVDASSLEVWLGTEYDLILSENQRQTI